MILVSKRIPHRGKFEDETVHWAFASHRSNSRACFGFETGPIDLNRPDLGVNQPCQLSSIGKPLFHLVSKHSNPVGGGAELNHEIGTDRPVAAKCGWIEILDAVLQNPGGIGRTACRIGEQPASGGIEGDASFVLASHVAELSTDFVVASTSPSESLPHDDKFPVSGQFEIEISMLSAQPGEGLVGHRTHSKHRRQIRFINQERHIRKYKTQRKSCELKNKAWGQNDDITVVTVRRTA